MNRRNCLKLLAGVLPCAFVARMLGEKDLHGTPSPNPAYETATHEVELHGPFVKTIQPWHGAVQTNNLHNADDAFIVKEFNELNRKIESLISAAKRNNWEIRDVKFLWRNINRPEGPDKFVRVLLRACDPAYPVYETNIARGSNSVVLSRSL